MANLTTLVHGGSRSGERRVQAAGGGGDHRSAKEDGVGGERLDDATPGGVGIEFHQQRVAGVAAGDVQGVNDSAVVAQVFKDGTSPSAMATQPRQ